MRSPGLRQVSALSVMVMSVKMVRGCRAEMLRLFSGAERLQKGLALAREKLCNTVVKCAVVWHPIELKRK